MNYDPYARLDPELEGWLALAIKEGEPFRSSVADTLLRECRTGYEDGELKWETAYYMIRSAMAREDKPAVRRMVNDWSRRNRRPSRRVSKFIPGDHYHVLDTKFDSLQEAKDYLASKGYAYAGLDEKYVPKHEGD